MKLGNLGAKYKLKDRGTADVQAVDNMGNSVKRFQVRTGNTDNNQLNETKLELGQHMLKTERNLSNSLAVS